MTAEQLAKKACRVPQITFHQEKSVFVASVCWKFSSRTLPKGENVRCEGKITPHDSVKALGADKETRDVIKTVVVDSQQFKKDFFKIIVVVRF